MVTAWQKRNSGPYGVRAFFVPQRHCRASVTLRDFVKKGKKQTKQNPGRTFQLHSTWIRVQSTSAGEGSISPQSSTESGPPTFSPTPFGSRARFQLRTYRPQKNHRSLWRAKVGRTLLKIQIHLIWKEPGQFWGHSHAQIFPIFSPAQGLGL